jgi:hypothetical protein
MARVDLVAFWFEFSAGDSSCDVVLHQMGDGAGCAKSH